MLNCCYKVFKILGICQTQHSSHFAQGGNRNFITDMNKVRVKSGEPLKKKQFFFISENVNTSSQSFWSFKMQNFSL